MEKELNKILENTLHIFNLTHIPIEIEIPRDESYGDLSTPIAMRLAKTLKKPPKIIAEEIKKNIYENYPHIFEKIEVAGQGFVNFKFKEEFLLEELIKIIANHRDYLNFDIGKGKKVLLEFVSANPTGPLHLGHGRGAAVGMALCNIMEAGGYKVFKEYYINDAGVQIKKLGHSVYARYRQKLCDERDYPFPEDGYRGDYIEEIVLNNELSSLLKEYNLCKDTFEEISSLVNNLSCQLMLKDIKKDLADMNVHFDTWKSEKELYDKGMVQEAIEHLRDKGLIYEKDSALWFKSTVYGDDKDRVVLKSNGEYTYFASDIAYHKYKLDRGFEEIIDIWGADHHGYIPRISSALQALGLHSENFNVLLIQMVTLLRDGKPVQMSKRAGEFITLREIIDEIGPDTTKFLFLFRRHDTPLEIDIEKAKEQSADNPVYYVQYAHARISSIIEKAENLGVKLDIQKIKPSNFRLNEDELRIVKKILSYPMLFKSTVKTREPHRIAFYLYELAGLFHPYYHKYRVITEDRDITLSRLALCICAKIIFKEGLTLLGVSAPDKM
ncbi:MAG TPA: arginine--tRNA ligase [Nitrospirae bacterium]|nr:arginine--tRNA ligase [Nitrospirota bacterium]